MTTIHEERIERGAVGHVLDEVGTHVRDLGIHARDWWRVRRDQGELFLVRALTRAAAWLLLVLAGAAFAAGAAIFLLVGLDGLLVSAMPQAPWLAHMLTGAAGIAVLVVGVLVLGAMARGRAARRIIERELRARLEDSDADHLRKC